MNIDWKQVNITLFMLFCILGTVGSCLFVTLRLSPSELVALGGSILFIFWFLYTLLSLLEVDIDGGVETKTSDNWLSEDIREITKE